MTTTPLPPPALWHDQTTGHWKVLTKPDRPTYEAYYTAEQVHQARADLESEMLEQARIIGIGAERELALMSRVDRLEAGNQRLREAIKAQLDPSWECNSNHPALYAAMKETP